MTKTMGLFVACFAAPVVLALFALNFNWLTPGETNNGQFVEQSFQIKRWPAESNIRWSVVMMEPEQCAQQCQHNKSMIKNIYDVLGKHNLYVGAYTLTATDKSLEINNLILNKNSSVALSNQANEMRLDSLYLVDHRGLVVLEYPVSYSAEQDTKMKKGLIKDVKKLLNYSRSRV